MHIPQVDLPAVPQPGDFIQIMDENGDLDVSNFRVRKTWWSISFAGEEPRQNKGEAWVECEYALGPHSSERHKQAYHGYAQGTGEDIIVEDSMY